MTDHQFIVIGAGQAGLAAGRELAARGADFVIMDERDAVGGSWPSYYDSLVLFSPARYSSLPDLAMPGEPSRYPSRDDVVAYLRNYAANFTLPVTTGARVTSVGYKDARYHVITSSGDVRTANGLVVATGAFGTPAMPTLPDQSLFGGTVLHSASYRNPEPFIDKSIVVVGAGNSAVQIAAELANHANVTLATRSRVRLLPQRILSRDLHWWFDKLHLNGTNLFSDHGVPVIDDGTYRSALRRKAPLRRAMFKRFTSSGVLWDDDSRQPVDAVIFATGFRPSLDFLNESGALDNNGLPPHRRGVSTVLPNLGYVGLSGQNGFASATLRGVGPDAKSIMASIFGSNHKTA
jgi:putative flavoprotein involved in K+ transport